jgi:hypothetical protein
MRLKMAAGCHSSSPEHQPHQHQIETNLAEDRTPGGDPTTDTTASFQSKEHHSNDSEVSSLDIGESFLIEEIIKSREARGDDDEDSIAITSDSMSFTHPYPLSGRNRRVALFRRLRNRVYLQDRQTPLRSMSATSILLQRREGMLSTQPSFSSLRSIRSMDGALSCSVFRSGTSSVLEDEYNNSKVRVCVTF